MNCGIIKVSFASSLAARSVKELSFPLSRLGIIKASFASPLAARSVVCCL